MRRHARLLWPICTSALTALLLLVVYPILEAKYGVTRAILAGGLLIVGMLLYYFRGMMLSRLRR